MLISRKTHRTIAPHEAAAAHSRGLDAANVRGGTLAWRAAQLPVTTGGHGSSPNPSEAA